MSHLGLMSPRAKGNSWAPHAAWLASQIPGTSPPHTHTPIAAALGSLVVR